MPRAFASLLLLVPFATAAEPVFRDGLEGGVPCVPLSATLGVAPLEVDLRSVLVTPQFLLDGVAFPQAAGEAAVFTLEDRDGVQLVLGTSNQAPVARRVLPGVYDLYYSWNQGTQVPRNVRARLLQALRITGDTTLVVDVPSVRAEGSLLLDGAPFPASLAHRGRISLQGVYGRGNTGVWPTHTTPGFDLRLIPGAYHVLYEHVAGDGVVPRNAAARVARLALDDDASALALDVPSVDASLSYTLNAVPLPAEDYEDGFVALVTSDGDSVPMGRTSDVPVVVRIVPGSYDVRFSVQSGGTVVPRNVDGVLATGVQVSGPTNVAFNTIAAQVTLLWDGAAPPDSIYDNADLVLVDRATGGVTPLGNSRDQPFDINLLPGAYDVRQRTVISNGLAPFNTDGLVAANWQPQATAQLEVDAALEYVLLEPRLNGMAFPGSIYEHAEMLLQDFDGIDEVALGLTSDTPWGVPLLAGTYRVLYRHLFGAQVPVNPEAVLPGSFRVGANSNIPILPSPLAVDAATLALTLRFDGVPLPGGNQATVTLLGAQEMLPLGTPGVAATERFLTEGTYRVRYQHVSGAGIPDNSAATVACVVLAGG